MTVWKIKEEDEGLKLQQFLQKKLKNSHSLKDVKLGLQRLGCKLNDQIERFGSVQIHKGDTVEWLQKQTHKNKIIFEPKRLLYEDDFLLAYNKPPAINTMEEGIFEIIAKTHLPLFPVHRLDKDTTGVLLFAKTKRAKNHLEKLFRQKSIKKIYWALTSGTPKAKEVSNYLGKVAFYSGQTIYGPVKQAFGKPAETHFEVMERGEGYALVKCIPLTGRTHQIRTHLKTVGSPIIGDIQYGWNESLPFHVNRVFLHAGSLSLAHPETGSNLEITAEIPMDFKELLGKLCKGRADS